MVTHGNLALRHGIIGWILFGSMFKIKNTFLNVIGVSQKNVVWMKIKYTDNQVRDCIGYMYCCKINSGLHVGGVTKIYACGIQLCDLRAFFGIAFYILRDF
jgi:hypothetical protein